MVAQCNAVLIKIRGMESVNRDDPAPKADPLGHLLDIERTALLAKIKYLAHVEHMSAWQIGAKMQLDGKLIRRLLREG
jgi:hypothetical protein